MHAFSRFGRRLNAPRFYLVFGYVYIRAYIPIFSPPAACAPAASKTRHRRVALRATDAGLIINALVKMLCLTRFVVDATENRKEGGVAAEVCSSQTGWWFCTLLRDIYARTRTYFIPIMPWYHTTYRLLKNIETKFIVKLVHTTRSSRHSWNNSVNPPTSTCYSLLRNTIIECYNWGIFVFCFFVLQL